MTDIEKIRSKLTTSEMLAQLAEECTEMAQAALKLRRVIDKGNPTPTSFADAEHALIEEHADVCACFEVLEWNDKSMREYIKAQKLQRWAQRLENRP